ncbi:MAG: hypothetical protein LC102_01890 [Ignavibacteriales bacterium]|nr:MAG: hypothetical protein F9K26_04360 [Ignavibacteriaceae bacterium]MBW7873474.1 hypothetical protein [Ignavibacteria bacterium]MCZ2142165.1 hypothetical protein [Ignavibacteriales bacterium]OQY79956.1 MAG: hypothetical protein B6D45_00220 [Ignavibacteriales bacterium UTCHB3]MBV6444900.1 hypothetical protein [Ignavibacteriaceae bacterium]
MKRFNIILFIILILAPALLTAQESIIVSLTKIDTTDYYLILEKDVNRSELWARHLPFEKSKSDLKLAVFETILVKNAVSKIERNKHSARENKIIAGNTSEQATGVATVHGSANEMLPVCIVILEKGLKSSFIDAIEENYVIIADNFKKGDYGAPPDVDCKGLIACEITEVAIEEAIKDFRKMQ